MKYSILASLAYFLFSCSKTNNGERILSVTIEPQRYFAEQLVDSLFRVQTVVPTGTSPETYDPSPAQMANLSKSAAYFTIGHIGFETQWLEKIKKNNPNLPVYDVSLGVDLIKPRDDADHQHDEACCDHDHDGDHGGEHELDRDDESEAHDHSGHRHGPVDPHTWSSPKQARIIVRNMCKALIALDPDNEAAYKNNLTKLEKEIAATDSLLTKLFAQAPSKSFIIYHPALTYLARDYGLTQYCLELDGKEPSPSQMQHLSTMAQQNGIKVVFVQEEFDKKNAETIAKETGARLVVIDPLSYRWSDELIRIANAFCHD